MYITFHNKATQAHYRVFSAIVLSIFLVFSVTPPGYAQTAPVMPLPGTMVPVSTGFTPAHLQGIKIFPDNPLQFDFFVHRGDSGLADAELQQESLKLIKYFLATLTIPENELWVNLSPYEEGRIIPEQFGQTQMGRDLLAQDYLLKQLTASLMYPEDQLGKKFWDRVYKRAFELFGTTEIPINTFNKVWIVPDKAVVFEDGDTAYVVESHLKVMLEEDYKSLTSNLNDKERGTNQLKEQDVRVLSNVSSQVVKEILIPEIEKEVNEGQNFASLRQIYSSMILAAWFKKNLKQSLLSQVYVNQQKTKGIETDNPQNKELIYEQYLEAFKQGVYNMVKEDFDPTTQATIARRYISGGFDGPVLFDVTQTIRRQDISTPGGSVNLSSMSPIAQSNIMSLPDVAVDGDLFRVNTRFFEFGHNANKKEVDRISSGPVNLSMMAPPVIDQPDDWGSERGNLAKKMGDIPHQDIKGRPESLYSVNRAIELAFAQKKTVGLFDEIKDIKASLDDYLNSEDVQTALTESGVQPDALKAKLADGTAKMILVEDVQARSPVIVMRNRDNFQVAHIGPSRQSVYLARTFIDQLERSGSSEDKEILKAFLGRELVALAKFNEAYTGNNYDEAIKQAESVSETFEKNILARRLGDKDRLDNRLKQSVKEFVDTNSPTFHLGVRNGLQLMAGRADITLKSDPMDNLAVHKELIEKALALPVAQQTSLFKSYSSFVDRNALFMNIFFSPEEMREIDQLKPQSGYYRGDHLTSFPAQELVAFDYVRNFKPEAFQKEVERAKQDVPALTAGLSHQELFDHLHASSERILSGLSINPEIKDQLTNEIESRIYAELLKRPSTDKRLVALSETTSRDGHQSNIGTNLTGAEQRAIIRNSLRYGNVKRLETWGGAVPQVALLQGRRGGQRPEDPFYNLREQTKLLSDRLVEVIGEDMDKIDVGDQRSLMDRYETKVDRKILRPSELEALLSRTRLSQAKKQQVRDAYEVKQEMLLRGEFIVGLTPYPDTVLKKFIETAYKNGMDVFRVFDAFNDPRSIKRAIKHVKEVGGYVQPVIHYTDTFRLGVDGYSALAKDLIDYSGENLDTLTIKDAPGVLEADAAYTLVKGLRDSGITAPLQLHTHDSRGNRLLVVLEAIRANGAQSPITVDVASGELAGPFAQVNIRQVLNSVHGTNWENGLSNIDDNRLEANEQLIRDQILTRLPIAPITSKERAEVTYARLPGGMKSNFDTQIMNEGLRSYWTEVRKQFGVVLFDFRLSPEGKEFMSQRAPQLSSRYGLSGNFDVSIVDKLTAKDPGTGKSLEDEFKKYAAEKNFDKTKLYVTDHFLSDGQKFLEALLPVIYDEMRQVVDDMGGISMVTPASQWVGVQAFQNIITGWIPQGWVSYDKTNNQLSKKDAQTAQKEVERDAESGTIKPEMAQAEIQRRTFPQDVRAKQYSPAAKIVPGLQNYLIMRSQDPDVLGRMYPNVNREVSGLAYEMIGEKDLAAQLDARGMVKPESLAKYDGLKRALDKDFVDMTVVKVFRLFTDASKKGDTAAQAALDTGTFSRPMVLQVASRDPKLNIPLTLEELKAGRDAQKAKFPEINDTDEDLMLLALFPEQNQFYHLLNERAKARDQYVKTQGQDVSAETLHSMGIVNVPEVAVNRSTMSSAELQQVRAALPAKNVDKALEVPWIEVVRAPQEEPKTGEVNRQNYFANQKELRVEIVKLFADVSSGKVADLETFKTRFAYLHRVNLLGLNDDRPYIPGNAHKEGVYSFDDVKEMAGKYTPEGFRKGATDISLNGVFNVFKEAAAWDKGSVDIKEKASRAVADLYNAYYEDNYTPFPVGNNSLLMNITNAMLRLHDLNGISHGLLDFYFRDADFTDKVQARIEASNAPAANLSSMSRFFEDEQPTVLLAEDDEGLRTVMAEMLQREGYRVITAQNGTEALEIARRGQAQMIVTDLQMPGSSGQEIASVMAREFPSVPVVLMTGRENNGEFADQAIRNGVPNIKEIVRKPIDLGFVGIVERVMRQTFREFPGNRSTMNEKDLGGIDMNPQLLDLQIKRDPRGVPLPLPQQPIQNMNIEGFLPVIINVTPVTNIPSFMLGAEAAPQPQRQSSLPAAVPELSLAK